MPDKITIRAMKKRDLGVLSGIYTETYRKFDVGEKWTKASAYKLLSYWIKRQPDMALVAECNGKTVGAFVAGVKPWWDGNHLFDGEIFVHPEYQRKGIGSLLTKAMFQKATKKYNATIWDTYTFKLHEFPLSWYKKMEFHEIKEWTMISGDIRKALRLLEKK